MKLSLKKSLIVGLSIVFLLVCFFLVDFILVKNMKEPIFCITTNEYWDGGSYECYGSFYKVNVYKNIHGDTLYEEMGMYGLKFDESKTGIYEK